jgi:hypothetical protein
LFGPPSENHFSLVEEEINYIPQISQEENEILSVDFTEEEVCEAITNMERNKTPGPDGFPVEFYQIFWSILQNDLMRLFADFQRGNLQPFRLNYGTIILLPNKESAIQIQQYRPICLLNVSFKIFTKVGTNRVTKVAHTVIRSTQTAFMPERYILDGVLILHETIHELHRNNLDGVLLKIDFEKAYDKVNWPFLQQVLRMKGFNEK